MWTRQFKRTGMGDVVEYNTFYLGFYGLPISYLIYPRNRNCESISPHVVQQVIIIMLETFV